MNEVTRRLLRLNAQPNLKSPNSEVSHEINSEPMNGRRRNAAEFDENYRISVYYAVHLNRSVQRVRVSILRRAITDLCWPMTMREFFSLFLLRSNHTLNECRTKRLFQSTMFFLIEFRVVL